MIDIRIITTKFITKSTANYSNSHVAHAATFTFNRIYHEISVTVGHDSMFGQPESIQWSTKPINPSFASCSNRRTTG